MTYNGKQLLSLASKQDAEVLITDHLRSTGKIGMNDRPPLKARCRPKAMKKSKICGAILRPETGFYVGSNHVIGKHTSLESARAALDQKMKDGPIRPKGTASKYGLRVGRISKLGSATRANKRRSCTEVLRRWRFLVEYGEPPARTKTSLCICFKTISLPR